MLRRPPSATRPDTLFPYTTLFRSALVLGWRPETQDVLQVVDQHRDVVEVAGRAARRQRERVVVLVVAAQEADHTLDPVRDQEAESRGDRKSTRLNSSH